MDERAQIDMQEVIDNDLYDNPEPEGIHPLLTFFLDSETVVNNTFCGTCQCDIKVSFAITHCETFLFLKINSLQNSLGTHSAAFRAVFMDFVEIAHRNSWRANRCALFVVSE